MNTENALAIRIEKVSVGNAISKKKVLIWAPVLATEPINMLLEWVHAVRKAGFDNVVLIFNGPGSESACMELRNKIRRNQVRIEWISGSGSIGSCQTFVTHLFLQSKARLLARVDPDGQFPIGCIERSLSAFEVECPDAIIGQWLKQHAKPLDKISDVNEIWRGRLHIELEVLSSISKAIQKVEERLDKIGVSDARIQKLQTIGGVGPRLSETVVAFLDDPRRFRNIKHVGS